jgi:hypothetical protein
MVPELFRRQCLTFQPYSAGKSIIRRCFPPADRREWAAKSAIGPRRHPADIGSFMVRRPEPAFGPFTQTHQKLKLRVFFAALVTFVVWARFNTL